MMTADIFCPAGTPDPTPAKAMANVSYFGPDRAVREPRPGEVWTNVKGDERLVIRVFSAHAVCFLMMDKPMPERVSVGERLIDPRMPATMLARDYGHFVRRLDEEEFALVNNAFVDYMGAAKAKTVEDMDRLAEYQGGEIARLREALEEKTQEVEGLKAMASCFEATTRENRLQRQLENTETQLLFITKAYDSLVDKILDRGGM